MKNPKNAQQTTPKEIRKKAPTKKWTIYTLEHFLESNRRRLLLGLFFLSLFLRVVYFVQAKQTALLDWHYWDQSDMHFFDTWAQNINKGDVLGEQPLHPVYLWNDDISDAYFKLYPNDITTYQQGDTSRLARSKNLWYHWFNGKNFHQEPLYPYLIALTYKFFGNSPHYVFFWQMLLGALCNVLIFLIGCRYFRISTGFLAAVFALLCGPIMLYDLVLLRTTLIVFLGLLCVWQLGNVEAKATFKSLFLLGLSLGLGFLNQSFFILYALFALLYIGFKNKNSFISRMQSVGIVLLGLSVVLIPLIIRNTLLGITPFAVVSNGGITFLASNFNGVNPYLSFEVNSEKYAVILHKTQGAFLPTFFEVLKQYNLGSFLTLMWQKFTVIIHWFEMPNNVNFYFFREWASVLRLTFVSNFILSPLALIGFFWAIRIEKVKILPIVIFLMLSIIPLMYGTPLARYRVLLLAFSTFFAAYTLIQTWILLHEKQGKKVLISLTLAALSFLVTIFARPSDVKCHDLADYILYYGFKYRDAIKEDGKNKNWDGITNKLSTFLEHKPPVLEELNANRKVKNIDEYEIAVYYLEMYTRYVDFLTGIGKTQQASEPNMKAYNLKNALEGIKY
jgi:4-amino-4-deoxy-L-arabinose transferase-like glycosyltransferase